MPRLKPPPAWIQELIGDWAELGGWTKASAPSCNRAARGQDPGSADRWTLAVAAAIEKNGRVIYKVPSVDAIYGLTPRELAAYYPPSDLWDDREVWAAIAYYQGSVADPNEYVVHDGVQKIARHVTTAILLAAPHVTHRHLVQMDQRATMADNLKLVEASLDKGTAMSPREIEAWQRSPQLYVGLSMSTAMRLPLPSGWWSNGGEPLFHPYDY